MKFCFLAFVLAFSLSCAAQDTTGVEALGKETVLSEVVIRNGFDVNRFLQRIKNDTTFYKAFRTLHILGFTSFNDIRMLDGDGKIKAKIPTTVFMPRNYSEGGLITREG